MQIRGACKVGSAVTKKLESWNFGPETAASGCAETYYRHVLEKNDNRKLTVHSDFIYNNGVGDSFTVPAAADQACS